MALFGFRGKNKKVSCARCNTPVSETDAKHFQGRMYCSGCYAKIHDSSQSNRQTTSSPSGQNSNAAKHPAIRDIEAALEAVKIKYRTQHVGKQWEVVLGISGKANSYQIKFICKDGSKNDVAMRVFTLARYPDEHKRDAYPLLASLQRKYRFIKFTLDKAGDINLEYDMPSCTESTGKSAVEMVVRTMKIVDEVYPEIMRSVWGQTQNTAGADQVGNGKRCPVCGDAKEPENRFCRTCFSKVLKQIRSRDYMMGKIPAVELLDVDTYRTSMAEFDDGSCPYCGTRGNFRGRVCDSCSTRYMDQIMQRAIDAKENASLLRVRMELFRHIKSDFPELKISDVSLGPTPSGGAYAVRREFGRDIFIGEYDENYREINHTRGRAGASKAAEKTIELPTEQIQKLQDAINKNYPGLTAYVRDMNLPEHLAAKYKPDMIIREKTYVDATARIGGMATTHRYVIMSNHLANFGMFEHGANWQLHVARRDSHFKVLGSHTYRGKTAIFLLHLPDDDSWKLFRNVDCNLDEDLLKSCIERFEAKCTLPPIPELAERDWLDRCDFPVGMDANGNFWDLE